MAIKKTPALFFDDPSLRKDSRRVSGFQIASPKMTLDEDDTMIPMKDVIAKPQGMVMSWDHKASFGLRAKREKSGSFTMRVAKLAIDDIIPVTIPQANLEP
jgi:hypothetical protein